MLRLRISARGSFRWQITLDHALHRRVGPIERVGNDPAGILPKILHSASGIGYDLHRRIGIGARFLAPRFLIGAAMIGGELLPQGLTLGSGLGHVFSRRIRLAVEGFHIGAQALGGAFGHLELADNLGQVPFTGCQVFNPAFRVGAGGLAAPAF